jgi:uncharacterized protein YbjT (DUF2867 family)
VILVTCANGNQGKLLLPKLLVAGHRLRACVHTEASAKQLRAQGVHDVLVGDLADPGFVAKAIRRVTSVYHIGPTLHAAEQAIGIAMIDSSAHRAPRLRRDQACR